METVKELHDRAMEFNEKAIFSLKDKDKTASDEFLEKAFEMEKRAFSQFLKESGKEPTRSILLKSALNLAMQAKLYDEAEKLCGLGLTLNLSPKFKSSLKQSLQDISFRQYLAIRSFQLDPNELQISLSGSGVGNGIIHYHEVFDRIEKVRRLVFRTAHRIKKLPYREKLHTSNKSDEFACSLIAQPVPGSFSVTLRFGADLSHKNPLFPDFDTTSRVIDDLLQNIELINSDQIKALESSIPDEAYRVNFLALAGKMAPDGESVKSMNLVSSRGDASRFIEFTKPQAQFRILPGTDEDSDKKKEMSEEMITLIGSLSYADADKDTIKVTDEDRKKHSVTVPKGLLTDIVKPYFKDTVEIQAIKKGKKLTLQDINPV